MLLAQSSPADLHDLAAGPPPDKNVKRDQALAYEADHALKSDNVFRTIDRYAVDMQVANGIIDLRGHVSSQTNRERAETLLRSVPGLLGIRNDLVPDDRLLLEVAAALASLEHQYACKFFTGVSHGVVSLSGIVDDENVQSLAEKSAASNPDVRGVINNIQASGGRAAPRLQPFLQPCIGEKVLFMDGVSGTVRYVMIDPDNRRVVGMAVLAQFAASPQLRDLNYEQAGLAEQLVVVLIDVIRFLTRTSAFLNISSDEKKQIEPFDPAQFVSPQKDWKPPYPYTLEDVLFRIGPGEASSKILEQQPGSKEMETIEEQSLTEELGDNDSLGG